MFFPVDSGKNAEVSAKGLSLIQIPQPKKSGTGPHTALADLAASGDSALNIVQHARGYCVTIPSSAVHSVWPFPDALTMDPDARVTVELQDRGPLTALCQNLAEAGIEALVTAGPW